MSIAYPNYFDIMEMTLAVEISLKTWIEMRFIEPVENKLCVLHDVAGVCKW